MAISKLKIRTLALLRNRPRTVTYDLICTDTGLKKQWLERFSQDQIPSPGVEKVETLYNYLSERPLGDALEAAGNTPANAG